MSDDGYRASEHQALVEFNTGKGRGCENLELYQGILHYVTFIQRIINKYRLKLDRNIQKVEKILHGLDLKQEAFESIAFNHYFFRI